MEVHFNRSEVFLLCFYDAYTSICENFIILQKQPPKVFYKKCVLKNFAIFTGKHLCWTLFAGLQVCSFIKKNSKKLHTNLNKCQVKRSLLVGTKFNFHMLIVGWNLSWLDRAKYLLDNPGSSHHNLRWYLENWSLKPIKLKSLTSFSMEHVGLTEQLLG